MAVHSELIFHRNIRVATNHCLINHALFIIIVPENTKQKNISVKNAEIIHLWCNKQKGQVTSMVGKNIKKFREKNGLTQDSMAASLGVTRQAVSNWETEKTQPDIDTLQRIAQILEVSVEEIIYGSKREYTVVNNKTVKNVKKGLSFGAVLGMIISYVKWQSIGWAIIHGLLNWVYVVYYILKYGWS